MRSRASSYCALSARGPCSLFSPRALADANEPFLMSTMDASSCFQQRLAMLGANAQSSSRIAPRAPDRLKDIESQVDHRLITQGLRFVISRPGYEKGRGRPRPLSNR